MQEKIEQLRLFYSLEKRTTFSEMATLFGYRSKNAVYGPLDKLIQSGYLKNVRQNPSLYLQNYWKQSPLGYRTSWLPSPAEEELVDTINLDQYLVQNPEATYLLTVSGDSMMKPAFIHRISYWLKILKKGDIIIAQVDGEWTMKYFGKDKKGIYLDPANRQYNRIRPERSLTIGGIVKAVIRNIANFTLRLYKQIESSVDAIQRQKS